MRTLVAVTVGLALTTHLLIASPAAAQDADTASFEVASIRRNQSGDRASRFDTTGNTSTAINMPVRALITVAYRLQPYQLIGAPEWVESERYDIVARMSDNAPPAPGGQPREQLMLRSLLAERFKLAVHFERRELPIYALVVTRNDGRLGSNLRRSDASCEPASGGPARPPENAAQSSAVQAAPPVCAMRTGAGSFVARAIPLSAFLQVFSRQVQRPVIDRTGLSGRWDIELRWRPDEGPIQIGAEPALAGPEAPSLFTALQEQLGLKLEATRGPVEALVVDHVERASED